MEQSGKRLDQAIAAEVSALSRTRSRRVVAEGGVFVDKKRVKVVGRIVRQGQHVVVHYNEELIEKKQVLTLPHIPIIELNNEYLVVNKPSGIFSAPTPESDRNDLVFILAEQLRKIGESCELFVVHRLDRPTSGLMLVARNKHAAARLSQLLESHSIKREYLALILTPGADTARIAEPISDRHAVTHFKVLERRGEVSLVHAELETGRTHQVRIHAEAWGSPILGDSKYGRRILRERLLAANIAMNSIPRLGLHAFRLAIPSSAGTEARSYECPLAGDLELFWDAQGKLAAG
jgi:23S rRNA pseudouridine1911/1915/1917 synthase